jgi:hypothetical protein
MLDTKQQTMDMKWLVLEEQTGASKKRQTALEKQHGAGKKG